MSPFTGIPRQCKWWALAASGVGKWSRLRADSVTHQSSHSTPGPPRRSHVATYQRARPRRAQGVSCIFMR